MYVVTGETLRTTIAGMNLHRVLIALSLALTALPAVPVDAAPRPVVTSKSYWDCSQSAVYGNRICFDETTVFGPVVQIFTSSTAVYASFAVNYDTPTYSGVCHAFVASPNEHQVFGNWTVVAVNNTGICSAPSVYSFDSSIASPSSNAFTASPANHDLIEWFGNLAGFEFVWVD